MRFHLWKKEGILPLVLGLLVLGAASYLLVFAPELRTIRSLKAEANAREAEVAESVRMGAAAAESRRGEGARWTERLRTWEEHVPSSPDTERLMTGIGELAVRRNLKEFGLTMSAEAPAPQGSVPPDAAAGAAPGCAPAEREKGLVETRLRLTFRSSFLDLANFLDDLPRVRRLLTIRSVAIKEKADAMVTVVELSAWHRRGR